jgi:hypothetical protein
VRPSRVALACALAVLSGLWCLPDATLEGLEFACDSGTDCQAGFRCWRGVCTQDAGWGLGTPCLADDDCANRICSAGVCCSRRCGGACERCDRGAPGQCDPFAAGDPGSPSCSPYFCDGVSGTCPGRCTVDGDCSTGTYCDAGACAPLQILGDRCVRGGTCASTFCVDGRCCDGACGNPCDACDVAGQLGRCTTSPLGRAGNPSCAPYACNGASTACPSSCTSDAGCVAGFSCSFFQRCQPKAEALYEPFDGTVLDGGTWTTYLGSGTSVSVSTRLELRVDPPSANYCGIISRQTYDATNTRLSAQMVLSGNQALATYETYFQYQDINNLNRFGFGIYGGAVHTTEQVNGTYTEPFPSVTYNPAVHRWFRLRVDGGVAIWETSADAGSFTVIGYTTTKPWMQTVYVELGAGTWSVEDAGTALSAWDNVRR